MKVAIYNRKPGTPREMMLTRPDRKPDRVASLATIARNARVTLGEARQWFKNGPRVDCGGCVLFLMGVA